jgi:hypothetical protein
MKAYSSNRGLATHILKLASRERRAVNLTPRPVYARERTSVPIEYESEWASDLVRTFR